MNKSRTWLLALDRLQNAVQVAGRNDEEIEKDVKKWLEDATKAIVHEDVSHLENEIRKNDKCFTCCPNCMRQIRVKQGTGQEVGDFQKTFRNERKVLNSVPQSSSSAHRISSIKGIHALRIVRRSF